MPKPGLVAPLLRVVLDDGAEVTVQALNVDMLTYERTARKRGWPAAAGSAPIEWITFLAWSALTREGLIPSDVTYESFTGSALSIEPLSGEPVDPTRPGAGAG